MTTADDRSATDALTQKGFTLTPLPDGSTHVIFPDGLAHVLCSDPAAEHGAISVAQLYEAVEHGSSVAG